MYDIKRLEADQQQQQQPQLPQKEQTNALSERLGGSGSLFEPVQLTCNVITPSPHRQIHAHILQQSTNEAKFYGDETTTPTHMTLLTLRRRRVFQRRACLLSILAAFVLGMALGIVVPLLGLPVYFNSVDDRSHQLPIQANLSQSFPQGQTVSALVRPPSNFPTIYKTQQAGESSPYTVAFIKESAADDTKVQSIEQTAEQVFRNAFHLEQDKFTPDSMVVKKLDTNDGSILEFHVQRTGNGRYRKGPERRLSKPTLLKKMNYSTGGDTTPLLKVTSGKPIARTEGIITDDIYWGELVERALPKGFEVKEQEIWQQFVSSEGLVTRLEPGCGRMQNRMVIFADGTRACARYRQNTDQIQGEIFSYYLGQLLNISNLAPSAATVIETTTASWSAAIGDITQAQWKERRPVVLTRWLPDLEPAGIPQPFQPLERHLNKYDVWNMTLGIAGASLQHASRDGDRDVDDDTDNEQRGLLKRLEFASNRAHAHQSQIVDSASSMVLDATGTRLHGAVGGGGGGVLAVLQRLIELAQWSDLIVFDYLIANLDRVVNNLYNFQWNADIMAAPAHNLARQTDSQLLVFLDNESGLLHGYRLLKKYEAYHSLLLDNLCIFRQPTIAALQRLRDEGAGRQLRELFEHTTSVNVRDVLPSLPDKSIKILEERIDRVLGQVQKCRDLLADNPNKNR